MADQGVYILRALISLYNFKPLFGLSSSPTNLRLKLYVYSVYTTLFWWPPAATELFSCDHTQPGDPPNPGVHTYQRLRYWSRVTWHGSTSADLQQPGETPQLFFFPWTPCHCIYRMDPQNDFWKIWISMCFDFTIFGLQNSWAKPRLYPPWVPRWDAPRSAAATVASSVPWSDISGGWLGIWIERFEYHQIGILELLVRIHSAHSQLEQWFWFSLSNLFFQRWVWNLTWSWHGLGCLNIPTWSRWI